MASRQKTQDRFGDERLKKDAGEAVRSPRENADEDRVHEDGSVLSASERRRLLRQEWTQEILPTPPQIPGMHLCWLSTTNSTDPIHKRIQLGYVPVKASEVPGLDQYKISDGQFEGCVACNEMILFKVPVEIYQDLMMIYHHDIPLEQEASIRDRVMNHKEQDSEGTQLGSVEGDFKNLGRAPATPPRFS